jgi:selenocysteine lyase/cysteine desulfurase
VIHLNNAGAGIQSASTVLAIKKYIDEEHAFGGYETELKYFNILTQKIYSSIGTLLGCSSNNIALFSSATEAWVSVVSKLNFPKGAEVWVSSTEYAANLIYFNGLKARLGINVVVMPMSFTSTIDLEWVASNISYRVFLVSVSHMPSCHGLVNPIRELGEIVRRFGAFYFVDACQTVGQVAINVGDIECDLLTGAGRKYLAGPRGTGFAFISDRLHNVLGYDFTDLHATETDGYSNYGLRRDVVKIEKSEKNLPGIIGLNNAVNEVLTGGLNASTITEYLTERLASIKGISLLCVGRPVFGIISFQLAHVSEGSLVEYMRDCGVNVWRGINIHTPLLLKGLPGKYHVRISPGKGSTESHIDTAIESINEYLATCRKQRSADDHTF